MVRQGVLVRFWPTAADHEGLNRPKADSMALCKIEPIASSTLSARLQQIRGKKAALGGETLPLTTSLPPDTPSLGQ